MLGAGPPKNNYYSMFQLIVHSKSIFLSFQSFGESTFQRPNALKRKLVGPWIHLCVGIQHAILLKSSAGPEVPAWPAQQAPVTEQTTTRDLEFQIIGAGVC